MSKYNKLKEEIKNKLLDYPVNEVYDDEEINLNAYESTKPRVFIVNDEEESVTIVGSGNFLEALDLVSEYCMKYLKESNKLYTNDIVITVFNKILGIVLEELEEEKVIKKTPVYNRARLQVYKNEELDNGRENN